LENALVRYRALRDNVWEWQAELSWVKKLGLAVMMAGIIGMLAQVRFVLPFTPVPVTGQTFAVLLAAVLLGERWGAASIGIYVGLGVAGIPWFTGFGSGLAWLAGPTGGYIVGFILAALFIGYITRKWQSSRRFYRLLAIMAFADIAIIFGCGLLQLNLWTSMFSGNSLTFTQLLSIGLLPFLAGETIKIIAAAGAVRILK